ncbi:hypothetical protein MC885_019683 [Smutsia gigantea]|nr:hypothetical protein MC885_019683 [Smutsia gigantea]
MEKCGFLTSGKLDPNSITVNAFGSFLTPFPCSVWKGQSPMHSKRGLSRTTLAKVDISCVRRGHQTPWSVLQDRVGDHTTVLCPSGQFLRHHLAQGPPSLSTSCGAFPSSHLPYGAISPLEVNTTIFSSLNDRPPASAGFHVASEETKSAHMDDHKGDDIMRNGVTGARVATPKSTACPPAPERKKILNTSSIRVYLGAIQS